MADLLLSCPHCGFSRALPADTVPDRLLRVTCPKCRESFSFQKPAADTSPPPEEASWPPAVAPSGEPASPIPPTPAAVGELRGIGRLFLDSWEIYLRRVGVLMGLYLAALLSLLLPVGLFALFGGVISLVLPDFRSALLAAGVLTGVVVGSVALFWGLAALVYAVADETLDLTGALKRGWSRIWAFAWVFSLSAFIVTGGFLLLVIPGILFSVWFCLSQFVLVAEDEGGMRALLKSKAYVQGKFIDVFVRLLAVWVVSVLIGMVPALGPLLSILFVPFMMIFTWLIYDDLRPKSGAITFSCTTGEKILWLGIGTLGFLVVPLSLLILILAWLGQSLSGFTHPWQWFGF